MDFSISIIPHHSQRYDTVGDYDYNGFVHGIDITVSDTGKEDYNFLVAVHELIEAYLAWNRKISYDEITKFDKRFERNRPKTQGEPGDDKNAPYHKEHRFATKVERLIAKELHVDWNEYNNTIINL